MRLLVIMFVFLFPFILRAQDNSSAQVPFRQDTIITAKLIGLVMHPPDCGIFSFASIQKFSIIESPSFIKQKVVRIGIACPELIGRNFFVTDQTYRLWLSVRSDVSDAMPIEEKATRAEAPAYWLIKAEKLN